MNNFDEEIASCLIYHVLDRCDELLGASTPKHLSSFLAGASARASFTDHSFPLWRIDGPLENDEFRDQYVAATGNPALNIGWFGALEICHFDHADSLAQLKTDLLQWHKKRGIDTNKSVWLSKPLRKIPASERVNRFWTMFVKQPGWFGPHTGWELFCFFTGMNYGGDWLQLPPMAGAHEAFSQIKRRSKQVYGTEFVAFRIYSKGSELMKWTDIAGLVNHDNSAG